MAAKHNRSVTKLVRKVLKPFVVPPPSKIWHEIWDIGWQIAQLIEYYPTYGSEYASLWGLEKLFRTGQTKEYVRQYICDHPRRRAYLVSILEKRKKFLEEVLSHYEDEKRLYTRQLVKSRQSARARLKAKRRSTLDQSGDQSEHQTDSDCESQFRERVSHRKGWRNEWQPTRKRYWRPPNNNWKQTRRCRKQYTKHLD